jgi:hypothetical protein
VNSAAERPPYFAVAFCRCLCLFFVCHSAAKRRNLLPSSFLPKTLSSRPKSRSLIARRNGETPAFVVAVACPFACHSAAQRRNPLLSGFLPKTLSSRPKSRSLIARRSGETPAFVVAVACPFACHSAAQRRNLRFAASHGPKKPVKPPTSENPRQFCINALRMSFPPSCKLEPEKKLRPSRGFYRLTASLTPLTGRI